MITKNKKSAFYNALAKAPELLREYVQQYTQGQLDIPDEVVEAFSQAQGDTKKVQQVYKSIIKSKEGAQLMKIAEQVYNAAKNEIDAEIGGFGFYKEGGWIKSLGNRYTNWQKALEQLRRNAHEKMIPLGRPNRFIKPSTTPLGSPQKSSIVSPNYTPWNPKYKDTFIDNPYEIPSSSLKKSQFNERASLYRAGGSLEEDPSISNAILRKLSKGSGVPENPYVFQSDTVKVSPAKTDSLSTFNVNTPSSQTKFGVPEASHLNLLRAIYNDKKLWDQFKQTMSNNTHSFDQYNQQLMTNWLNTEEQRIKRNAELRNLLNKVW